MDRIQQRASFHPSRLAAASPFEERLPRCRKPSPFCRLCDIFPRPGEVFPQRESLWRNRKLRVDCQGLSPWERWHGASRDGEGEAAPKERKWPPPFSAGALQFRFTAGIIRRSCRSGRNPLPACPRWVPGRCPDGGSSRTERPCQPARPERSSAP